MFAFCALKKAGFFDAPGIGICQGGASMIKILSVVLAAFFACAGALASGLEWHGRGSGGEKIYMIAHHEDGLWQLEIFSVAPGKLQERTGYFAAASEEALMALADGVAGLDAATPVATSGSQYQVPTALAYGTWYWRVCAVNADGVPAAWSTTWSFATAPLVATVSVAGGTFQMGSVGIAEPVHSVTVSSFLIAKYEVTQAQYQTVVGSNPSSFTSGADAPNRPVERVSWYNAVAFCNALSALEGLTACYTTNGTTVTADFAKNGYRLPTEAEWEYAARGRAPGPVYPYTYAGSNDVNSVAWYSSNSGSSTHPVGTKGANELGIYDM